MNYWILLSVLLTHSACAFDLTHWFLTPDQEAMRFMNSKNYEKALSLFDDKAWHAIAAYRLKQYKKAAAEFESLHTADGYYNQGNALAALGLYDKAIAAYNKTLRSDPTHQDAQFNKKVLEALQQQQKKQQEKKGETGGAAEQKQDNAASDKPSSQNEEQNEKQNGSSATDQKSSDINANNKGDVTHQQNDDAKKTSDEAVDSKVPQQKKNSKKDEGTDFSASTDEKKSTDNKEKVEMQQQLRMIPDDPGGLLREMFLRDYLKRRGRQ